MSIGFTKRNAFAIAFVLVEFSTSAVVLAQCATGWTPMGPIPGVNVSDPGLYVPFTHAIETWDPDGMGPIPEHVIVAGRFGIAGNAISNSVAMWDGTSWSALGTGTSDSVYALTVYNGEVIAGGGFNSIGSFGGAAIGRWNGTDWYSVGSGAASQDASITALVVFDGELIAGGNFTSISGTAANNIARWNGTTWQTLGTGIDGVVTALFVFENELYAGGGFTQAGGETANNVAKWNGATWSPVGDGFDSPVSALAEYGGELYAGGFFATAEGNPANRIARWNGTIWQSVGTGTNGSVYCLRSHGGLLYVGGLFSSAGGNSVLSVATWNGSTWSAVGSNSPNYARSFGVFQGQLLVGGNFNSAGTDTARNVARWDNSAWHSLGAQSLPVPSAFGSYQSDLVIAGSFTTVLGVSANNIARLVGNTDWQPLGAGVSGTVNAMAEYNTDLIVAGSISSAGGNSVNRIARWDGTTWHALGQGIGNGVVNDLVVHNGVLYVGGTFTTAGGSSANRVAAWDGANWTSLGSGLGDYVRALAIYNGELIAGGRFWLVPGENLSGLIGRWNGSSWEALGGGLRVPFCCDDYYVNDLAVFNNELVVVGSFPGSGTVTSPNSIKWNGSNWANFGAIQLMGCNSFPYPCPGYPKTLMPFGSYLYVGGDFGPSNPGVPDFLAKSSGGPWVTTGAGFNAPVNRLWTHAGQLLASGGFTLVDSKGTIGFARFGEVQPIVTSSTIGACGAEDITLSVSDCQPGSITYQWRKDGFALSNGGNITGAQSSSLLIDPVSTADQGEYDAYVTGNYGAVLSTSFSLTIAFEPPVISIQPSGPSVCTGAPIQMQVEGSGGTIAYQWRKNGVNLSNGGRISGATTSTLTISPSLLSDTDTYDVVVTNGCGDTPSDAVAVLVQSFPIITSEPEDTTGCDGDSVMLSLSATVVPPVTYQWRKGGFNLSNTSPFSGVNTPTLTINPASEFDTDNYDCVITDACNLTVSNEATVTISSSPPILGFGPDPVDTCAGQYVSLAAQGLSSPSPSYQWRKDGDPIDGATDSFIEFLEATAADSGMYDVVISNGCGEIIPPAVQVNVFATATADGNLDTTANGLDIPGLLDALLNWDFVTFSAPYCAYDMNADAYVDNSDIPGVVAVILGS